MFQALRQAARRAAPKTNGTISAQLTSTSALAVATVLIALASEQQNENEEADVNSGNSSSRTSSMANQLPFLLPTNISSHCKCELSTKISRLRRSATSKLMAAEATHKTFFSLYEVDFDHPLGQGAYGDVYMCRDVKTGEECALKKIPKVVYCDVFVCVYLPCICLRLTYCYHLLICRSSLNTWNSKER